MLILELVKRLISRYACYVIGHDLPVSRFTLYYTVKCKRCGKRKSKM